MKVFDKKKLEAADYNYLLKIDNEEEKTKLCNSLYTINIYEKKQDSDFIIFELEDFEDNLKNYIYSKGELEREIDFFREIVLNLAKALI